MATKTPAERAIADVEKAIKDVDKAYEKYEVARVKADELGVAANRAARTLNWTASHPDLPDDFDVDEFRRSLAAPFDDDQADELEATMKPVPEPVEEIGSEIPPSEPKDALEDVTQIDAADVSHTDSTIGAADEDDPWAESA